MQIKIISNIGFIFQFFIISINITFQTLIYKQILFKSQMTMKVLNQ